MRVPGPVKAVFDQFPLVTLPAWDASDYTGNKVDPQRRIIAVYSLDADKLPLDPKCLAATSLLILLGQSPAIEVRSPLISAAETLPILYTNKKAATSLDQMLSLLGCGDELVSSPQLKAFRSLVDTWLEDAWHGAILDSENTAARESIYAVTEQQFPWPFSRIANDQLVSHLEARHMQVQRGKGDTYVCTPNNMRRVGMALAALENAVSSTPLTEKPSFIDILVFSYTWPILTVLPESALAALISPALRQHANEVRGYLLNVRGPLNTKKSRTTSESRN